MIACGHHSRIDRYEPTHPGRLERGVEKWNENENEV